MQCELGQGEKLAQSTVRACGGNNAGLAIEVAMLFKN
jgi:hypothetical protein